MFLTPLTTTTARGGYEILARPLWWRDAGNEVKVPAGFVTDRASVPASLQGMLKKNGNASRSAVLHDFLYATQPMPRKACDLLFARALRADGVRGWRLYYAGVRVGGRAAWDKYAHELKLFAQAKEQST